MRNPKYYSECLVDVKKKIVRYSENIVLREYRNGAETKEEDWLD